MLHLENPRKNIINPINDSSAMGPEDHEMQDKQIEEKAAKQPTGIERYFTIPKRKRSPNSTLANANPKNKIPKPEASTVNTINRFAELSNDENEKEKTEEPAEITYKPPPIYLREHSSNKLIKQLKESIGENNFYLADLKRGQLYETKIQTTKEMFYCKVVDLLEKQNKHFYTYQLKSAKGLKVIIKGIDHQVDPNDIKADLEEAGFEIKNIVNVRNRNKIPQPMFKIELTPEASKVPKGKVHPIYNVQYILYRRVTIEEPHKHNTPVQCQNCQEYGHTKMYCKLSSICVACGGLHSTTECTKDKNDVNSRKCSNCNGHHTANFRGCPVYAHLLKSINRPNRPHIYAQEIQQQEQQTIPQPSRPTPFMQRSNYTSYADVAKSQMHQTFENSPQQNQDSLNQIIFMLVTNMQQITATIQEMQKTLVAQNALLTKLASK